MTPEFNPNQAHIDLAKTAIIAARTVLAKRPEESSLRSALASCIAAGSKIAGEHRRIDSAISAASSAAQIEALQYQRDLAEWQFTQAAKVGRWRLAHLNSLGSPQTWEAELQRCQVESLTWIDPFGDSRETSGLLYWFAHWAWTYDPRPLLKTVPFYLFPVQEKALLAVEKAVFADRGSLLIDKSRDMGVTWIMADWNVYHWRFTPGFASLLGNRTEDEVDDSEGDMGATFNKIRFQVRLLPKEMLPAGFNERRHMTYMALSNPQNKANIAGGAPIEDFGRGDRRTVINPDEFASWKQSKGFKQYQSMAETSDSLIITSTVKGIFNKYGELLLDPAMPKVVVDWRDHPWKDERWYRALPTEFLGAPRSPMDIAQEIDRDPYASQPGQVLTQYSPVHNIITRTEFQRVYGRLRDQLGEFRIPPRGWNVSVGQDVGTTPEHPNVTSYFTRPRELDPYPQFVFGIKEMVRVGLSTLQIALGVKDESGVLLKPGFMHYERQNLGGCRIVQRVLSHEATNEQFCYQRDCTEYKTTWAKWPGDANGGIEQIDNAMTLDRTMRNPFVIDPRTLDPKSTWLPYVGMHFCDLCQAEHLGAHLQGCSRFFLVVPDEEGELLVDGVGNLIRRPAKSEAGFHRARYEAPGWHYPESEKGKPVRERKPEKGEDDFWDSARMQMAYWLLTAAASTKQQKIQALIPDEYKPANPQSLPAEERAVIDQGFYYAYHKAKRKVESQQVAGGVYAQARAKYGRKR